MPSDAEKQAQQTKMEAASDTNKKLIAKVTNLKESSTATNGTEKYNRKLSVKEGEAAKHTSHKGTNNVKGDNINKENRLNPEIEVMRSVRRSLARINSLEVFSLCEKKIGVELKRALSSLQHSAKRFRSGDKEYTSKATQTKLHREVISAAVQTDEKGTEMIDAEIQTDTNFIVIWEG